MIRKFFAAAALLACAYANTGGSGSGGSGSGGSGSGGSSGSGSGGSGTGNTTPPPVWDGKYVYHKTAFCPKGKTMYRSGCPPPTDMNAFCPPEACSDGSARNPHTCLCACPTQCPQGQMQQVDCSCNDQTAMPMPVCSTVCSPTNGEVQDPFTCECHPMIEPPCAITTCPGHMMRSPTECACLCPNIHNHIPCNGPHRYFDTGTCQCETERCGNGAKKHDDGSCPQDCPTSDNDHCRGQDKHANPDNCGECTNDNMSCPQKMCQNGNKPDGKCDCL